MSSRANYVVIRDSAVQVYLDRHGAAYCALFLTGGPEAAAKEAASWGGDEETNELLSWHMAEGGVLVDFDERLVLVHGDPDLESDDDEDPGPEVTALLREGPAAYFDALAPLYPGWTLRWDERGTDAYVEHLIRRDLLGDLGHFPPETSADEPPTAELHVPA